jgi:hypothetical protein
MKGDFMSKVSVRKEYLLASIMANISRTYAKGTFVYADVKTGLYKLSLAELSNLWAMILTSK